MRAQVGDKLVIAGDPARTGLIIGVPHDDGSPPYVVKWLSTGHIAMVSPGEFARILPAAQADSAKEEGPGQTAPSALGAPPQPRCT